MTLNKKFEEAIDLIKKSQRILITTHTKPDGDALGSLSAMYDALRSLGKDVRPLVLSQVPQVYEYLFREKIFILGGNIKLEELKAGKFGDFDLIVIVDTNSYMQLPHFEEYLKQKQIDTPVIVFDHHRISEGIGAFEIVEADAAAAGLVILEFFKYTGWNITERMAEALFAAISTDTGWFRFNNTDKSVFSACTELINLGAKPPHIFQKLYETCSFERFKLKTAMLNTIELHLDGRFATMQILKKDFENTGATYADTENLINESRIIKTVDTTALFIELNDGRIRCSLRSKGNLDVGKIAEKFGGGGHKMAAGTFITPPVENAKKLIYNEVLKNLV